MALAKPNLPLVNSGWLFAEEYPQPEKLLLLVHGRGGKWPLMQWFSKRLKLRNFCFLCLQAPHPEDVKAMKEPGFSWYLMPGYQGLEQSRKLIDESIDQIRTVGFRAEDIFWLGFSQGSVMGVDLFLRHPERLGGLIGVSGFALQEDKYQGLLSKVVEEQRFLLTHGYRDEIVSFEKAKNSFEWLKNHKIPYEFLEYNKPHSFDLKNEIPKIESVLHDWSC